MATEIEMENEQLDNFSWDEGGNISLFEEETVEQVLTEEEKQELKSKKYEKSAEDITKEEAEKRKGSSNGDPATNRDPNNEGNSNTGGSEDGDPNGGDPGGGNQGVEEPFSESEQQKEVIQKDEKKFFKTLAVELKEAGVFANVEIKDDDEIDQDKFIELQDAEVEARVDESFEAFFKELDEDGKAFLKFKKEGGDTRKFFEVLQRGAERPTGDSDDKKHQEKIVRHYLATYEEMPQDEIDDRIEWLQSTGKLKKSAQVYDQKMTEIESAMKDQALAEEKTRKDRLEAEKVEFIKSLTETINKTDEVNNIPITKKDKAELLGYITKPAVKVGQNRYVTQFQADLKGLSGKTETLLLLAKLLKNNFDLSDVQRKEETKQVTKIKEKLEAAQKGTRAKGSGSSINKSLADYF